MDIPPASENPFQSPGPFGQVPNTAAATGAGTTRLGDILGRAFNSYLRQWSEWPVPVLLCGLILIGCELACFLPVLFAQGPVMCALFACAYRNLRGWPVDSSALGRGWQVFWPAASSGIALMLIQALPLLVIGAAFFGGVAFFGASMAPRQPGGKPDDAAVMFFAFGFLAFYLLFFFGLMIWTFYFSTRTMFVLPLVADRGYGFSTAWHVSWEATRRRFWERLLLVILASIIGGLGVYVCYVGIIFTVPLYFLIIAAAYDDEFGASFEGWDVAPMVPQAPGESPFLSGGPAR